MYDKAVVRESGGVREMLGVAHIQQRDTWIQKGELTLLVVVPKRAFLPDVAAVRQRLEHVARRHLAAVNVQRD